jgi:hypothetical protein
MRCSQGAAASVRQCFFLMSETFLHEPAWPRCGWGSLKRRGCSDRRARKDCSGAAAVAGQGKWARCGSVSGTGRPCVHGDFQDCGARVREHETARCPLARQRPPRFFGADVAVHGGGARCRRSGRRIYDEVTLEVAWCGVDARVNGRRIVPVDETCKSCSLQR